jgi:iron complex outermembrane receptor protein
VDEKLTAYEIGYRQQFASRASLSISTYYNVYDDLRSFEFSPGGALPIVIGNKMEGDGYGVEIWGDYRVRDWWRLSAGVNWLHQDLRFKAGSTDPLGKSAEGDDPRHQFSARSAMNITDDVELDFGVREVGRLPNPAIPSYVSVDARIGWHFLKNVELSLSGTNLFDDRHQEFGSLPLQFGAAALNNIGRTVFVALRGKY